MFGLSRLTSFSLSLLLQPIMLIPPPLSYIILATACLISVACPAFAATAADYRVAGLPGLAAVDSVNIVQHAGHIELDAASNANMFFWLIHKQKNENNDKFVIWLNGGTSFCLKLPISYLITTKPTSLQMI
ncbi:hypothetical protein BC936DRAFT_143700 [Jimgerdemannia flammicorona]|uniref:Alpha/Beta hydrolase protein n=1 Tax=Jimgerdemannia flammicorona TaxID=994334 RepID=A0A432ZZ43_9FUNG|nr:hypothetical protein BC936DRAFT_143700 [Jimgerdemannia flammicorona]